MAVNGQVISPDVIREITFVGMPKRKPEPTNPPGWALLATGLRDVVRQSGLSVAEIAKLAGMSRQHLYDIMNCTTNPTMEQISNAFAAAGTPMERWLTDRMMYGRDKGFHDRVQHILDKKGPRSVALKVVVDDDATQN